MEAVRHSSGFVILVYVGKLKELQNSARRAGGKWDQIIYTLFIAIRKTLQGRPYLYHERNELTLKGPWGVYRQTYINRIRCVCSFIWKQRSRNRTINTYCIFTQLTLQKKTWINPLKPELNFICYLLALLGAHHFLHVSRIRVKLLTFRLLLSYIYGAPILDVSRSLTTTQHSR